MKFDCILIFSVIRLLRNEGITRVNASCERMSAFKTIKADPITWFNERKTSTNYYEIMGISETCATDEIKKRYRQLALITHPDRYGRKNSKSAADAFAVLNRAYHTLMEASDSWTTASDIPKSSYRPHQQQNNERSSDGHFKDNATTYEKKFSYTDGRKANKNHSINSEDKIRQENASEAHFEIPRGARQVPRYYNYKFDGPSNAPEEASRYFSTVFDETSNFDFGRNVNYTSEGDDTFANYQYRSKIHSDNDARASGNIFVDPPLKEVSQRSRERALKILNNAILRNYIADEKYCEFQTSAGSKINIIIKKGNDASMEELKSIYELMPKNNFINKMINPLCLKKGYREMVSRMKEDESRLLIAYQADNPNKIVAYILFNFQVYFTGISAINIREFRLSKTLLQSDPDLELFIFQAIAQMGCDLKIAVMYMAIVNGNFPILNSTLNVKYFFEYDRQNKVMMKNLRQLRLSSTLENQI